VSRKNLTRNKPKHDVMSFLDLKEKILKTTREKKDYLPPWSKYSCPSPNSMLKS
jgi:hypothetical protein